MQKKIIAAAVAVAFSTPAFAENSNITVYGRLNADLESVKNDKAMLTANATSLNRIVSNAYLGFKGGKDLGRKTVIYGFQFRFGAYLKFCVFRELPLMGTIRHFSAHYFGSAHPVRFCPSQADTLSPQSGRDRSVWHVPGGKCIAA